MNRRVMFAAVALISAFSAAASCPSPTLPSQDSASSQKASEAESQPVVPSPEEHKKTKKVWTNDNLRDVSGSAISQVGDARNSSTPNSSAKPASVLRLTLLYIWRSCSGCAQPEHSRRILGASGCGLQCNPRWCGSIP